ncbi:ABC transporter permease [Bacillus sp. FJAT-22090]|uniref:ABC transporter permease n=1 Tax=Bacillus sp. FJAT-22090 TaxID=1581038 RepID=UPI0011A4391B|nr:ABC transporter permease [Bacillus sp. FJAT-22090]
MNNLVKSELFKLSKDRSFWTLVIGLAVVAALYPLLIFYNDSAAITELVSVKELFAYTGLGGNNYIVKLVPCILAGFFISSEYSMGTMKIMGSSGNSRIRIYFAKLLIFTLGAVIISLIFPIVLTGVGAVFAGFYDMPGLSYLLRAIGLTVLYTAAFASIMAFISIIFTDSGKTIGFLILFFILFDSVLYALSQKFSFIELIFNHSVFKLFIDIGAFNLSNGELFKLTIVPIITYLVLAILGSLVFHRKEIK